MRPVYENNADHLLGPINGLRAWSRNYTVSENYFDITIFTRMKFSSTRADFAAYAKGRSHRRILCNREGSVLFPNARGARPRCCVLEDQKKGEPQGSDIFKGK